MKNLFFSLMFCGLAAVSSVTQLFGATIHMSPAPEIITLLTQAEVDAFPSNYPGISDFNNITIGGDNLQYTEIVNLDSLYVIESINGILSIEYNTLLNDLTGLNNLQEFILNGQNLPYSAGIVFRDNPQLTNLEGISSVKSTTFPLLLRFESMPMENLPSFSQVESALLNIKACNNLVDLKGLDSLKTAQISLEDNANLTSLEGLENLEEIIAEFVGPGAYLGGIAISKNPVLNSLVPLSNVTTVSTFLHIIDNDALTSFTGLENVTIIHDEEDIAHELTISGCENLSSIAELGIEGVENIKITDNPALSICNTPYVCYNLDNPPYGIPTEISGNNTGCESIEVVAEECLPGLVEAPELITLQTQEDVDAFLANYPGISDFNNITIGGLSNQFSDIVNLDSLYSIESMNGMLIIEYNELLNDLTGLNNLETFTINEQNSTWIGGIVLRDNPQLTNLEGISSVKNTTFPLHLQIESIPMENLPSFSKVESALLTIKDCDNLEDLTGLESLKTAQIRLEDNSNLTSLEGLENLEEIIEEHIGPDVYLGGIVISKNPLLNSLGALSNLTKISQYLHIIDNDALTSFTGLENLTVINDKENIAYELTISGNENLSSIAELGIEGVENIKITDNPVLSICNTAFVCYNLANPPLGIPTEIMGNNTGCENIDAVSMSCLTDGVEALEIKNFVIAPNPASDQITLRWDSRQAVTVYLYNNIGVSLDRFAVVNGSIINISELPDGLYHVLITDGKNRVFDRFVKGSF